MEIIYLGLSQQHFLWMLYFLGFIQQMIKQALSHLRASQADHDKLLVKQASDASSLSDHINHLDQKWETFADLLSNDIKEDRKKNDAALAALKDSISQLQDLLKAQLADNRWKDNGCGSGSSSSLSNEEEEEEEKEKRKPMLNLTARHQDLQQCTAKHNTGDSLGDVRRCRVCLLQKRCQPSMASQARIQTSF